jgi:hypothetical protein
MASLPRRWCVLVMYVVQWLVQRRQEFAWGFREHLLQPSQELNVADPNAFPRSYTQGQDSSMSDQSWYAVVRVIYSPSSDGVCEEELSASLHSLVQPRPLLHTGRPNPACDSELNARATRIFTTSLACLPGPFILLLWYPSFHCLSLQLALFWM